MFGVRNYYSNEEYDIGKYLDFKVDVYDVVNSPFLEGLRKLPVERYYVVENGNEDLDVISQKFYSTPFLAYQIQFYNDLENMTILEGTMLKLFSLDDLNKLVYELYTKYGVKIDDNT